MFKQGLICRKIAGTEKGHICVILERDKNYALIDGDVKRRKCNISHLEPLAFTEIKKDTPKDEILKILKDSGFEVKIKEKKKWMKKHKEK